MYYMYYMDREIFDRTIRDGKNIEAKRDFVPLEGNLNIATTGIVQGFLFVEHRIGSIIFAS